jgi:hypothetical protein
MRCSISPVARPSIAIALHMSVPRSHTVVGRHRSARPCRHDQDQNGNASPATIGPARVPCHFYVLLEEETSRSPDERTEIPPCTWASCLRIPFCFPLDSRDSRPESSPHLPLITHLDRSGGPTNGSQDLLPDACEG